MMHKKDVLSVGDWAVCMESGVIGQIIKFYIPTACEEQTMVRTPDGRHYHAPTRIWKLCPLDAKDTATYI